MLKFVSGNYTSGADLVGGCFSEWIVRRGYPILASCAYPKYLEERTQVCIDAARDGMRPKIMYDSGAFTAWKSGRPMTLDRVTKVYASLMERLPDEVDAWFITLDKIPGTPQHGATDDEVKRAEEETLQNTIELRKRFGDRILPVWRNTESVVVLEELLHLGASYICLSMIQTLREEHRVAEASRMIKQVAGRAKLHGLAATGCKMMGLNGWHSVDSASWQYAASMGSILYNDGKRLIAISVSNDSPNRKRFGKHYETLSKVMQEKISAQVEQHGFTISQLAEGYKYRGPYNVIIWQEFDPPEHKIRQEGLFDE